MDVQTSTGRSEHQPLTGQVLVEGHIPQLPWERLVFTLREPVRCSCASGITCLWNVSNFHFQTLKTGPLAAEQDRVETHLVAA